MRRLREWMESRERGATMVTFALLSTMLFGFIGLGVDGAVYYAKRQEAQNGADAAALAIAQEYATTACAEDDILATGYIQNNATWGTARHVAEDVDCATANRVTVDSAATFDPFFSQIIGIGDLTARGSATVEWGAPYSGAPLLPITFAVCDFDAALTGAPTTIYLPKHAPAGYAETCERPYGSDENIMPAGFGFLGDGCSTEIRLDDPWVEAQTGASIPSGCSQAQMLSRLGQVILLPVFDRCRTGKNNVDDCDHDSSLSPSLREYHIYAFAAWRLDGYYLNNTYKGGAPLPCGEPRKCVSGSFVRWVDIGEEFEIGPAPDTDTLVVRFVSP